MAFPLAAMIAGDPVKSYQGTRKRQQDIDTGDVEAQGQAAAGNAYMGLFGPQQTPGAMPAAAPQQPQPNMLQALLARLQGGASPTPAPGVPPPAGPTMPPGTAPQQGAVPSQGLIPGAQPTGPPASPRMPMQPGQGAPPMPGQPPQGQPSLPMQGAGGPQLDWRTIVQKVIQANPGVKDPRVIAAAVDRFIPLMNSQSLMEWRQQSANFRGIATETARERADTAKEQGSERIKQADKRIELGASREERLTRESSLRNDRAYATLDMQRQRLEQQIIANKDRTQLGQWRAILDAQHKRATEIIGSQAAGMDPKERKRLLDEENEFYTDQIEMMKNNMEGGKPGSSATGHPAAPKDQGRVEPTKVQTPADVAKLPKGTRYITPDGQTGTAPGPSP